MVLYSIVRRELNRWSRQRSTYWRRVATGAAGALLIAATLTMAHSTLKHRPGWLAFASLGGMAFFQALMAGPGFAADTLSGERRDGTLSLLFLSGLRPSFLVLGQWLAFLWIAGCEVLIFLPFLPLPWILGGISVEQMGKAILLIGGSLAMSLSIGQAVSARCFKARTAMGWTYISIVVALFGPWALGGLIGQFMLRSGWFPATAMGHWKALLMPMSPIAAAMDILNTFSTGRFWQSMTYVAAVTGIVQLLAVRGLNRSWHHAKSSGDPVRRSAVASIFRLLSLGDRGRWLDRSCVAWLYLRRALRGDLSFFLGAVWGACLAVGWCKIVIFDGAPPETFLTRSWGFFMFASVICHWVLKAVVAYTTSRIWLEARRSGTWETLRVTPLKPADFIRGACYAEARRYFPVIAGILAADIAIQVWFNPQWTGVPISGAYYLLWTRSVFLILDLAVLVWLSLWVGFHGVGPRTGDAPFFIVVVAPWVLGALIAPVLDAAISGKAVWKKPVIVLALLMLTIGYQLFWLFWSHRRIHRDFQNESVIQHE